jgi:WD40 repeat protein
VDRTVKIWDPQTGVELITLLADQGAVYGLAFNPKTDCLLTLGADGNIAIWDPRPVNLEFLPR